jgi:short-subunit dehydrogenase
MNKNIIIIGLGPKLGFAMAKKFGENGFVVGLISRNESSLKERATLLQEQGINVFYHTADAYYKDELEAAISVLKTEMGIIDVLFYNAAGMKRKNLLSEETDDLVKDFRLNVAHVFHSVTYLLDDLRQTKGTVLLTGGGFSLNPNHEYGSLSLGKAGLRNLALQLNEALKEDDIYVGTLTINGHIQEENNLYSPSILANMFWEMYMSRIDAEIQY